MQTSHRHLARTSHLPHALLAALVVTLSACGGGGESNPPPSREDDIRTAQQCFANLRDNARTLQDSATGTGIADDVEAFGEVVQVEASLLATAAAASIRLDRMAFELRDDYRNGRTPSRTLSHAGSLSGCTVFEGAFPTMGTDFTPTSVEAASPAAATWVGCSKNSGPLSPTGARRYHQTKVYDMAGAIAAGSFPGAVPYLAVTRSELRDTSVTPAVNKVRNLTRSFDGTAGVAGSVVAGRVNTRLQGDLPPLTDSAGNLLADKYVAAVNGSVSVHASGTEELRPDAGKFTSEPLATSTAKPITIDLADTATGPSVVVLPVDATVAAQRQASHATVHGTITHGTGRMAGSLVADRFDLDANGELILRHLKFTGDLAVLPRGAPRW